MNKLLPDDLQNLSTSKQRVIHHVEQHLHQSIRKRHRMYWSSALIIVGILTCMISLHFFTDSPSKTATHGEFNQLLQYYLPTDGTFKRHTISDGSETTVFVQWLSDTYMKESITTDSQQTTLYYRIKNNRLDYVTSSAINESLTIAQLNTIPSTETLFEAPFEVQKAVNNQWYISAVDLHYNFYEEVIRVELQKEDGYHYVRYYAPTVGLIEEEIFKNGQHILTDELVSYSAPIAEQLPLYFVKSHEQIAPAAHTPWLSSPSDQYKVTIEGRGIDASEQQLASIVIEERATEQLTAYHFQNPNDATDQLTPKQAIWLNDTQLLVIIGPIDAIGGSVYKLNLADGTLQLILDMLAPFEEVTSVQAIDITSFHYEKSAYDGEDKSSQQITEGVIRILPVKLVHQNVEIFQLEDITTNTSFEIVSSLQAHSIHLNDLQVGSQYTATIIDNVLSSLNEQKE